jgi:hypothetical protein
VKAVNEQPPDARGGRWLLKDAQLSITLSRGDWIRTSDLLLPKQALYRAKLRPAELAMIASYDAPGRTRTSNLLIRSQMLYPIELRAPT